MKITKQVDHRLIKKRNKYKIDKYGQIIRETPELIKIVINIVQIETIIVEKKKIETVNMMWKEKDSFREMDLSELGEEETEIVGQKVEMRRVK